MENNRRATVKTFTSNAFQQCENKKCTKTNTWCLIPYTGKAFDWESVVVTGGFITITQVVFDLYRLATSSSIKEKIKPELKKIFSS